jgi:hypothetical protein
VRQHLGRHDAHHVPARVHQRPARIARLHRQADLEIAWVIRRARQRRDFPLGQLGRKTLQASGRKTDRGHRAAQFHRATRGNGQWLERSNRFQQRRVYEA